MTFREAGEVAGKLKMMAAPNRLMILLMLETEPMCAGDLEGAVGKRIAPDLKSLVLARLIERGRYGKAPLYRYRLTAEGKRFRNVIQYLIEEKRGREHEASPPLDPWPEIQAGEAEGPGDAADAGGLHPPQ